MNEWPDDDIVSIVTGGGGTLALASARAFLEHGLPALALLDISFSTAAEASISKLRHDFPSIPIITRLTDVTDADSISNAIASAANEMSGVAVLITFAGVVSCAHALETAAKEWSRVMAVNTTGTFLAAQAVAKEMVRRDNKGGSIIFIASISASKTNFPQPQAAYNASKAAVVSLGRSLAAEWAVHGIRVNVVSPGYLDTVLNEGEGLSEARKVWSERNPMGRMGDVEEVVGMLVLLAARRAGGYVTGSEIRVDGGQSTI